MTPGIVRLPWIRWNAHSSRVETSYVSRIRFSIAAYLASPTDLDVLHPHDIDMRDAALDAAEKVVLEVLVREESNHRARGGGCRASRRARTPCGGE
jgi:hypothetical protein